MQKRYLLLAISVLAIFILLIISQSNKKPILTGEIEKIKYSNNRIAILLKNNNTEIILFTNKILNLKIKDKIEIYGRQEKYKNTTQIIADKIIKI